MVDLSVKLGNVTLKNPIMPASGTFGYGNEFLQFFDISKLGAIVTKGLSLKSKPGNNPPRIFEGDKYLINSIGLENVGYENFIKEKLPFLKSVKSVKIINFFGNSEEEYYILAEKLDKLPAIDALEVNISCPNVKEGGIEFGLNENMVFKLISNIRKVVKNKTLIVKISPMASNIISIGIAIEEAGADGITAINTIKGIGRDFTFYLKGGISGPFLKPVALRIIEELNSKIKIPIIGCGGIFNLNDVIDFLKSGATAIQVGTANFSNPLTMINLINELSSFMKINNISTLKELRIK